MAIYFGQDEAIYPLLAATDIADDTQTALRISGNSQGNIALNQARQLVIQPLQSAVPTTADPIGSYSVQTGASRGFYTNNGSSVMRIVSYPQDGSWPIGS